MFPAHVGTNRTKTIHDDADFYWYTFKPPFDDEGNRLALLERLTAIQGVSISKYAIAKRPPIELRVLDTEEKRNQFLAAFNWYLEVIRQS